MNKLNAFTLIEVTFAMLISAICVGICYSAYTLIGGYYQQFREVNEQTDEVLALRQVLEKDFLKSKTITHAGKGVILYADSTMLKYTFEPGFITRTMSELHTDTFDVQADSLTSFFEGKEIGEMDTLDQLRFSIRLRSSVFVPIEINKKYSATDLYR